MKKIKENLFVVIVTSLLTLAPIAMGLYLWNDLPDSIPIHFDVHGVADGFSSKPFAVFGIGALMFAFHLVLVFATALDPKNDDERINNKVYALCLCIVPAVTLVETCIMYGTSLNLNINVLSCTQLLLGIVFILVGNYLPKTQPNYTIGIKVPWTFNDPDNWYHTHRLGGYCFILAGLLYVINGIFQLFGGMISLILPVIIAGVVPIVYSYLYYRKNGVKHEEE